MTTPDNKIPFLTFDRIDPKLAITFSKELSELNPKNFKFLEVSYQTASENHPTDVFMCIFILEQNENHLFSYSYRIFVQTKDHIFVPHKFPINAIGAFNKQHQSEEPKHVQTLPEAAPHLKEINTFIETFSLDKLLDHSRKLCNTQK